MLEDEMQEFDEYRAEYDTDSGIGLVDPVVKQRYLVTWQRDEWDRRYWHSTCVGEDELHELKLFLQGFAKIVSIEPQGWHIA